MAGDRFAVLNTSTGNLDIKADGATIAISTLNLSVVLGLTYGGTAAALTASTGGIVYSSSTALAILSGTATANKVLMSGATAAPTWSLVTYPNAATPTIGKLIVSDGTNWIASTPTYPTAATPTAGKIMIADGTNWVASTPTHPTAATAGKVIIGDGTNWVLSTPTYPNASTPTAGKIIVADGTNWTASLVTYPNAATPTAGKLIISDGTNWTASAITYPNAAPAAGKILRGDGSNFATSTFTIVDTMAISTLLYASTANIIQALPTANNGILITGATGVPSIGSALPDTVSTSARQTVAQGAHAFVIGDVLKFAGGVYAKALADTAADAEVVGMCSNVIDAGNFMLCSNGYVSGLTGLTANTLYYLSGSSAGALTATAPTTEGYINKPVFFATSTTAGYFINYRGVAVTTSTSYYQAFVNADLAAGVLTVNHNLGHKYCTVQVFDNSDIAILPDTITLTSTTALTIDLTSYGAIAGTRHAVVLDIGSQLSTPVAVTSGGTGLATIAAGKMLYASALNTIVATSGLSITTGNIVTNISQPAFSAKSSFAQAASTGDGTHVSVVFGTKFYDQTSSLDAGTGLFTAPVTGRYRLTAYVYLDAVAATHTTHVIEFVTTARTYQRIDQFTANPFIGTRTIGIDVEADMSAGDTCGVVVWCSGGAKTVNVYGDAGTTVYTYFCGSLVC